MKVFVFLYGFEDVMMIEDSDAVNDKDINTIPPRDDDDVCVYLQRLYAILLFTWSTNSESVIKRLRTAETSFSCERWTASTMTHEISGEETSKIMIIFHRKPYFVDRIKVIVVEAGDIRLHDKKLLRVVRANGVLAS